jgi:hypothetical protein
LFEHAARKGSAGWRKALDEAHTRIAELEGKDAKKKEGTAEGVVGNDQSGG